MQWNWKVHLGSKEENILKLYKIIFFTRFLQKDHLGWHRIFQNYINWSFLPDFKLVAKQAKCNGAEKNMGYVENVYQCSLACQETSEMFIYGTNKHGESRCREGKCLCICEMATKNFHCNKQINHNGYYLYKSLQGEISNCFIWISYGYANI